MPADATLRRVANKLLPRPVVVRLSSVAAAQKRRSNERKLDEAPELFRRAYAEYWRTGTVPTQAEELLFLATWASGGTLPRRLATERGQPFDAAAYAAFPDDLLADVDPVAVASGVEADGYYVVPSRLSPDAVDDILEALEGGPAKPRGDGMASLPPGRPEPTAPTWWMDPAEALRSPAVRRLLQERRLAEVGGHYLGADPMIMSVVLWKSFAWSEPDKSSAQAFHFDNDRASFVKMFVYLTDVDATNGPHTYVAGSHRDKPKDLLHGQRLSDADVARFYPTEKWQEITGPRGTVFFADTQGFHKGGHVVSGERAIFQVNLASDRFGIDGRPLGPPSAAPAELAPALSAAPRFFSQLFPAAPAQP